MATFKVFFGEEKPLTAVGKNQCHLLGFAAKYPGWHYASDDRATQKALKGLLKRGSLITDSFGRFSIAYSQYKRESKARD